MSFIKPFRALRFTKKAGEPQNLICPPYDTINPQEHEVLLQKDMHNAVRLELPLGETRYADAAQTLQKWLDEGVLKRDSQPALYLYEEEFMMQGERLKNKGILCLAKLEDCESGMILPHEETQCKEKEDRFALLQETHCTFSPFFALYEDTQRKTHERIERLSCGSPRYEFRDGEVTHRLWVINDLVAIQAFQEEFTERRLWIADGHQRCQTALDYQKYCRESGSCHKDTASDYGFSFLADVSNPGLAVLPLHRLIRGMKAFSSSALLKDCGTLFDIYEMPEPHNIETNMDALFRQGQKAFAFYAGGETWWLLRLKDNTPPKTFLPQKSDTYRNLDVALLHGLILDPLLGITEQSMEEQEKLTYTRSFTGALSAVQSGEQQCAFFVNPARVSEICRITEQGEKMPQNSTYFYPKPATGLIMRQLELSKKA